MWWQDEDLNWAVVHMTLGVLFLSVTFGSETFGAHDLSNPHFFEGQVGFRVQN